MRIITAKKLMKEHKRLLEETKLGAWDIYYTLEEYMKGDEKIERFLNGNRRWVYWKNIKRVWRGH